MKTWISVALLAFVCFFQKGDAQITGWSVPSIVGSASGTAAAAITFPENENTGQTSTQFTATPTGSDTITAYTLLTSGTPFSVASGNGFLSIDTALDFETTASYTLKIQADDSNTPANTGVATVTVTVTDVNEAPTFTSTSFTTCVVDGSAVDTSVTTLTGTDQDAGDTITYTVNSGQTTTYFGFTGAQLSVSTTIPSSPTQYMLVIHATDNDATPLVGSTTVTVNVQSASECSSATALAVSFLTMLIALVVSLY